MNARRISHANANCAFITNMHAHDIIHDDFAKSRHYFAGRTFKLRGLPSQAWAFENGRFHIIDDARYFFTSARRLVAAGTPDSF